MWYRSDMSELCAQFCPNYRQCVSALDGAAGERALLMSERANLERAVTYLNVAEMYGAFSILSGELTAEEHEAKVKEFENNPAYIKVDFPERFQALDMKLAENDERAYQIALIHNEVTDQFEFCDGPTLGVVRSLFQSLNYRKRGFRHMPPAHQQQVKNLDNYFLKTDHGKCPNTTVAEAIKKLPHANS